MKIHCLDEETYNVDTLESDGVTWIVYDYEYYICEGQGQSLMRYKNKWLIHDMGHCSCYEPFENIDFTDIYKDFNAIYKKITGTWLNELIPLIDFAKAHEKEWNPKKKDNSNEEFTII